MRGLEIRYEVRGLVPVRGDWLWGAHVRGCADREPAYAFFWPISEQMWGIGMNKYIPDFR